MDNQIKTSFIPRKTIDAAVNFQPGAPARHKVGKTVFSVIATFIFIGALVLSGLVYTWKVKLGRDIVNQVEAMRAAKDSFDEKFIQEASRLNTRIESSMGMLQNHVSPSSLYALLEEYTLQTVAFSQFAFKDNQDGTIGITGLGEAARYESIVLQSDAFGKSGYLRNVIFTNLRPDQNNQNIGFSFEATLDPRLVLYRNSLIPESNNNNDN